MSSITDIPLMLRCCLDSSNSSKTQGKPIQYINRSILKYDLDSGSSPETSIQTHDVEMAINKEQADKAQDDKAQGNKAQGDRVQDEKVEDVDQTQSDDELSDTEDESHISADEQSTRWSARSKKNTKLTKGWISTLRWITNLTFPEKPILVYIDGRQTPRRSV